MGITASEVNKLRQTTGSGMMDCKNALVEADGDIDAAIEILRKRGQKVAAKRGDRDAAEGLVIAKTLDGKKGVIIRISCETDFVAKNDDFVTFAETIAKVALENEPSDVDALKALPYEGNGVTVGEKILEQVGKIGEKIEVSAYESVAAETVVAYNHPGNQIASIVGLNKAGVEEIGRDVAMQIAAMAPVALDKDGVDQTVIDKEIEIGKELARNEGKPEAMLEKIAMGKLNKFFKENTLLNQQFIKDNKKSVSQILSESVDGLTVSDFKRLALG